MSLFIGVVGIPYELINNLAHNIQSTDSETRILAASFKNIDQVLKAVRSGATHVTVGSDVIDLFLANANISKAVDNFASDWYQIHGNYEV